MKIIWNRGTKGVTLVELLLACAVAIVGITIVLSLAADVLNAGIGVTRRNVETAQARVALMRLRNEVTQAQAMEAGDYGVTLTISGSKIHWGVATFAGAVYATHLKAGIIAAQKDAVAANVSGLTLSNHGGAITLGITAGKGHRRVKLQEVIRRWGQTL